MPELTSTLKGRQVRPRQDYLTVELEPQTSRETSAGIYIAGSKTAPDILMGKVIAVGPKVDDIAPGQRVGVPSHCCFAKLEEHEGRELIIVKEKQVEFEAYGSDHIEGTLGGEGEW